MYIDRLKIVAVIVVSTLISCGGAPKSAKSDSKTESVKIEVPKFNADSAYRYTEEQLAFGYRIPNTKEHRACAAYLADKLHQFGADTLIQRAVVEAYDGTPLNMMNIIGSYSPEKSRRVMLFAHWDSRPFADNDPDPANHRKPILGTDDGAASVAMLLEMARLIGETQPNIGIDIILFDAEDYGTPYFHEDKYPDTKDTWALGSQYWSKNPHKDDYRPEYGILLDMVSGTNSIFYQEQVSKYYAPHVVKKVWDMAHKLGHGSYFPMERGGAVTDDHYYVNLAGIPSVDIIAYFPNGEVGFPEYWHTLRDNMDNIDKNTMRAVGETVLNVIYNE